ncbi:MAG: outer membrane lipoprotein carrier protein LolA, partial [Alphaproteobacteria bacterium]
MAGTGQGLFVGVAVLGMVALGWAARAETVPLPTPAPLPKETGSSSSKSGTAAQSGGSGLAAGVKSLFHLDRQPETSATAVTTSTGFNASQRAQVDKVSTYLSNVQQLVGDFVQVGPDGSRVRGEFYMQKPGKIRFEYEPPSRIEIIADGQSVVVRDRKLATQDLYPLS